MAADRPRAAVPRAGTLRSSDSWRRLRGRRTFIVLDFMARSGVQVKKGRRLASGRWGPGRTVSVNGAQAGSRSRPWTGLPGRCLPAPWRHGGRGPASSTRSGFRLGRLGGGLGKTPSGRLAGPRARAVQNCWPWASIAISIFSALATLAGASALGSCWLDRVGQQRCGHDEDDQRHQHHVDPAAPC